MGKKAKKKAKKWFKHQYKMLELEQKNKGVEVIQIQWWLLNENGSDPFWIALSDGSGLRCQRFEKEKAH